jgi:NTE family protein
MEIKTNKVLLIVAVNLVILVALAVFAPHLTIVRGKVTDAHDEIAKDCFACHKQPSIAETVGAMSDIQLHRYNAATLTLMKNAVARWAEIFSTPDHPVGSTFVSIGFSDLPPSEQPYFNEIPTSFALSDEQVDRLISAGRELLRTNPDFQRPLRQLEAG